MYRAIALFFIQQDIPLEQDPEQRRLVLDKVSVEFKNVDGNNVLYLNDKPVDAALRTQAVNAIVSEVAAMKEVREKLKLQQQAMGAKKGIVMDGRDIGTVIFPDAELKVFVTADIDIRSQRRLQELVDRGMETTLEEVKINLLKRDHIDSTRDIAPLKKAANAYVLDTSHLSRMQQLDIIKEKVKELIS